MPQYDTDKTFNALAIRDTALKTSTSSDHKQFTPKTIAVCNKLNQQVTFQLQGSFDNSFAEVFNIGATFNVAANTNGWQNASVYFPYLRLTAQCSTAPTTGTLTVFVIGVG